MVDGPEYPSHLLPGFRGSERNYLIYDPGAPLTEWTITINWAGWREPEYPQARPPRTKRLMVLGDSVTFGMGVDDYYEANVAGNPVPGRKRLFD